MTPNLTTGDIYETIVITDSSDLRQSLVTSQLIGVANI